MIPCIDLQDGRAVQLVHGRKRRLAVDDVFGLLERFGDYPLLHMIDLDAAMGKGSNARLVRAALPPRAHARACGRRHTHRGASGAHSRRRRGKNNRGQRGISRRPGEPRVPFGLASQVGRKRVIVAVDTEGGTNPGARLAGKAALASGGGVSGTGPLCVGISVHVRGCGRHHAWHQSASGFAALRGATKLPITAAGGIRSHREVRALERLGMNAAVGMALYLEQLR